MSKKIILVGAGENSRVIANILKAQYQIVGFLDDAKKKNVIGKISDFVKYLDKAYFFITIGNNASRKKIFQQMKEKGAKFVNAIHGKAYLETSATIGENVFIGALAYINIHTRIGDNVFINNGCIVEHDNLIKDHCHLAPGVITGGKVKIGHTSFIGLGACIIDHIAIGDNVIIGSGAVVINNIDSNTTAVGVPAKTIKQHK